MKVPETETTPCVCGKRMIRRYSDGALAIYRPQHPWEWWCGGCGRIDQRGDSVTYTKEQSELRLWQRANGELQ